MRYEINIGRPDEAAAIEFLNNVGQANEGIGDFGRAYSIETSYEGPDGPVVEHTVVLSLQPNDPGTTREFVARAFHLLAAGLGEDCIAILAIDDSGDKPVGYGTLVGPGSEKWGSFDLEKFERFDEEAYAIAVALASAEPATAAIN